MATRLQDRTVQGGPNRAWLETIARVRARWFLSPLVQGVVAALAVAALTVASLSFGWNLSVALCLYIALVVALSFFANIFIAVGAAIVAGLSMDYFLTEPRFSFAMADPVETLALVLFVGIAYSTATLVSRLNARTRDLELANLKLAKHSEMMLEQAQEFARVNRVTLMGEMTASIAHEINQPLTGIISNAGTSIRYLDANQPDVVAARKYLAYILRDGTRAAEVIKRLRATVRRTPSAKEVVYVNELIEAAPSFVVRELETSGTELRYELQRDLPAVCADPVQVGQVLVNLLLNANEAMDEFNDRERSVVVATGLADAEHVFVEVRDSGPGLRPDDAERLFDPFYTTKADGMGMGLAICRVIVEGHGGKLQALPNHPAGAVFRFTLPVKDSDA